MKECRVWAVVCLLLFVMSVGGQEVVREKARPTVGLVLEGGGALGLAHVGVLQWFEENRIPVDGIAGTSMGALIGSLYATGHTTAQLNDIATKSALPAIFTIETAYSDVGYRRREDRRDLPQAVTLGLNGGVSLRDSLLTDTGLNAFLAKEFAAYNSETVDFDTLPIPFRCVATDLDTLEPVVFSSGPMPLAVRSSISIPGVFSPVKYMGHHLVDGAALDNLPTDVAREDLHVDVVIAVHLAVAPLAESEVSSIVGVFARAYSAGTARSEKAGMKLATLVIQTKTEHFGTGDYSKGKELVRAGYEAAESHRAELLQYQMSEAEWKEHLAARRKRARPAPGILRELRVEGGPAAAREVVRKSLEKQEGQPISEERVAEALREVEGSGSYVAAFETFSAKPEAADAMHPDTGVAVRLSDRQEKGPSLLLGLDLTAETSNVTRSSFDFRLIDRDFGGYDSELRTDVRVGFLTQLSAEYFRPLWTMGWFVKPDLDLLRKPVYLWVNQQRVAERFQQGAGGGLNVGRVIGRNAEVSAGWKMHDVRWELTSGTDGKPDVNGSVQAAVLRFKYDRALTAAVSPKSLRLDVEAGSLYGGVAGTTAPLVMVKTGYTMPVTEKDIVGFGTDVQTYFRRNVADPFRFTTGGPLKLSASSIDEYRATDDYMFRLGYLRRLAVLPSGLGQGVYATLVYEGGEMWSPEKKAILRQDGLLAIVASTPLGVITMGGSVGDAGRRKLMFTIGKLF